MFSGTEAEPRGRTPPRPRPRRLGGHMTNAMLSDARAVSAQGLTKRYGETLAVDHLDLDVPAHSVVALLGPNGAGKTTTVRMIATLELPTEGALNVCGFDPVTQGDAIRSRMSLTGQFAALEDNLTANENLVLMARLRGYRKSQAKRITAELVDRFDIGEFRDKLVK